MSDDAGGSGGGGGAATFFDRVFGETDPKEVRVVPLPLPSYLRRSLLCTGTPAFSRSPIFPLLGFKALLLGPAALCAAFVRMQRERERERKRLNKKRERRSPV